MSAKSGYPMKIANAVAVRWVEDDQMVPPMAKTGLMVNSRSLR